MIWALRDGTRIKAEPNTKATCPCCNNDVIPKCGSIITHHWAHKANDCDPWHEPESQWHINWKSQFPHEWQEVVMGKHRADVKTPTRVVEFQSSSISAEDIRARENHYGNMIWVLNGRKFSDNFYIRRRDGYHSFRWYHPRKSWWQAERMVLIDLPEEGLFMIEKIYSNVPCRGWGYYVDMALFMEMAGVPLRMEVTA